jgi:arylsulfatase A-like enzyme
VVVRHVRRTPSARVHLLLVLALCACRQGGLPTSLEPSFGRFVAAQTVYVLLGEQWKWVEADGAWQFKRGAEVYVFVARPAATSLRLELDPDPLTAHYALDLLWDGRPLGTGDLPQSPGDPWTVEVRADQLEPGLHHLLLRRRFAEDRKIPGLRPRRETVIRALRVATGDRTRRLGPDEVDRTAYLRDFLRQGITGRGQELLGGVLLHGPGRYQQPLLLSDPARLETTVENASDQTARFRVGWEERSFGEVAVPAGERRPLGLELSPGHGRLTLEVEGPASGLFLFGEPHLVADERRSHRPDIVLVTLDTTRRDAVAPFSPEAPTPALKSFARTATVFTRAYATSPWTLPSHASIFTGLWPGTHRASLDSSYLPFHWDTLPERLRRVGYFTVGFAGGYLCHHSFGLAQGMHRYRDPDGFETPADRLTDAVTGLLHRERSHPLFLFVNYFDPHALYQAPSRFRSALEVEARVAPLRDRPVWGALTRGDGSQLAAAIRGQGGFGPQVRAYLRAAYEAEVAFMDSELGRLFRTLRETGRWDDALVVVVADHGELLGEHDHFTHSHRLDPELTEIPLMIKWPHQTSAAQIDSLASQVDLFPTLLRAAGVVVPEGPSGLLLDPANHELHRRRRLFAEEHDTVFHPLFAEMKVADDLYAIQGEDWREVLWEDQRRCARRKDGAWVEAPCPERPGIALAQLQALLGDGGGSGTESPPLTAEEEAGLRALGYL